MRNSQTDGSSIDWTDNLWQSRHTSSLDDSFNTSRGKYLFLLTIIVPVCGLVVLALLITLLVVFCTQVRLRRQRQLQQQQQQRLVPSQSQIQTLTDGAVVFPESQATASTGFGLGGCANNGAAGLSSVSFLQAGLNGAYLDQKARLFESELTARLGGQNGIVTPTHTSLIPQMPFPLDVDPNGSAPPPGPTHPSLQPPSTMSITQVPSGGGSDTANFLIPSSLPHTVVTGVAQANLLMTSPRNSGFSYLSSIGGAGTPALGAAYMPSMLMGPGYMTHRPNFGYLDELAADYLPESNYQKPVVPANAAAAAAYVKGLNGLLYSQVEAAGSLDYPPRSRLN
ncbi:unnamed protein product, partial [Protopolystoma xenopodis]